MSRTGFTLLIAVIMSVSLTLAGAWSADAHTCSSACNQIRRACLNLSEAVRKVARANCDDVRDDCRDQCAENADTGVPDCDAAKAACDAGCAGDTLCLDGCAADHTQCLDDCANCIPRRGEMSLSHRLVSPSYWRSQYPCRRMLNVITLS